MRMRLGLLQDPEVIDRQVRREQEELERKRNPEAAATAKTKEATEAETKEKEEIRKRLKGRRRKIKPLSESKAIDSGATFISESFLFLVAGGLIVWESWRRESKEGRRRDEVQMRLEKLEEEMDGLRVENVTLKDDLAQHRRVDGAVGARVILKQQNGTQKATGQDSEKDISHAEAEKPHDNEKQKSPNVSLQDD